ncbi:unnamed protein product, partial [Symbiodinium microadriaticum]
MAGSEGSGLSDRGSQAPPGLGENLLSEVGIKFKIGSLQTEKGGSAVSCQVIGIALLEGGFLVAVPHAAWHRTGARRYLPPDSLVRPVLAEVLAAGEGDRREAHPVWRVKVWIGTLRADLAQSVIFGSSDEAATFGAGEEEAEVVFTIAGSGGGPGGPMPAVPFGPSLSAVANDHFAFVSAAEAPEEPQDRRLDAVEAAIAKLQTGMESLLSRLPGAGDLQGQAAPVQEPRPKASAAPPAGGVSAVGKALPGLDPAVVRSARAAGVPEVQLQRMSAMVSNARRLPAEPPRQGISPLDDEDEDLPAPDGGGDRATGNPLDAAVLKMSEILQHMHRDRRGGSVEDVLDRAEGGSDPTSVTLGAGKSKMNEDFTLAQSGPGLENLQCSARAWIEHRSLLQSYAGPIRQAWTLGGIIDSLDAGDHEPAKATALLALASLDQAAVDGGSWVLASEIALEGAPPFGSFARPRVLDQFEARQSRLLDSRFVSGLGRRREFIQGAASEAEVELQPSPDDGGSDVSARDRGPTSSTGGGQRLWPMPLPYPSLLLPGCGERDPDQLALNAIVLVLDWLHLGQPSVCKAELGLSLGRPLNPRQWRALDLLRGSVHRWNRGADVGPSEMGRAAAKFEGLEDLLEGAKGWTFSGPLTRAGGFACGRRQQRNALALSLTREELRSLSCCAKGPARQVMIPCLNTLAMGDTHAVNYGQTAHLSVVLRQGVLRLKDFVTLKGRPPRSPALTAGLLIDDMILLDPVERRNPASPPRGLTVMKRIREGYESSGLPRHCGKAVSGEWEAEFWGGLFDGKAGILRPNPKRVVPLGFFLVRLVRSGVCCGSILETVSGGLVAALQMRRRLLSLLDRVYAEQGGRADDDLFPLAGPLSSELLACAALLCTAEADLRTPGAPLLVCTDASSTKEAGVASRIPEHLSIELCRHGLQKGLWSRLLGALPSYLRERGELDPAVYAELPGESYEHHPMLEELCCSLQFFQVGQVVSTKRLRHINVGELRAALRCEADVGNRYGKCRYMHILDSQVAAACLTKGRSSSAALNFELSRSLPAHLALGTVPRFGFIRSAFNPADDPTRDVVLRQPSRELPSWWASAVEEGDFSDLDAWLRERGMHLDQLRELPPEDELLPDAQVSMPGDDPSRLCRRQRDPEGYARAPRSSGAACQCLIANIRRCQGALL